MGIFELHLELNQRLQEVASYKRDKFKSQELDLALNKAMFRLLEEAVNRKFEDTQIKLGHVSALIQKNYALDIILPQTGDPLLEDNQMSQYAVLPPDLYWTINCRNEVITDPYNCGNLLPNTLATTTKTEYVAVVSFPGPSVAAPYYTNTTVTSSVTGLIYTNPPEIATTGFNSINSSYVVINNILDTLARQKGTLKVYWERYRDTFYKEQFIFVSTVPIGVITITSGAIVTTGTAVANTYTIYNRGLIPALTTVSKTNPYPKLVDTTSSKITRENSLYDVLNQNIYYKTRAIEPIIDETEDYLIYYSDSSFIITRGYIDYIRKPRTISLVLNQTCELNDAAHPKVIDLALEILRLDTKDPSYPTTVQDTQLRTG